MNTTKLACLLAEYANPSLITDTLNRLTYSHREIKLVQTLLHSLRKLPQVLESGTRQDQFFLFQQVGSAWPGLAMLAVATGITPDSLTPLNMAWLDQQNPIAHPPCLLTGADLIAQFGLTPGPKIGQILTAMTMAQATGVLTSREQALAWVSTYLDSQR